MYCEEKLIMGSDLSSISIITAVYNNKDYIKSSLNSSIKQTGLSIDLIVIDGQSSDGSLGIIKGYKKFITSLISEPDEGVYYALNKGVKNVRSPITGFLHSDDLFMNNITLKKILKVFNTQDVDAVYGDLVYVDRFNPKKILRYWKSGEFKFKKLKYGWMPPHPTLFIRSDTFKKIGLFNTKYKISADYDFMLRLLTQKNIKVAYIPEVLVKMRVGGVSNRSLKNIIQKSREDYQIIKANKIGGLGTLFLKNITKIPQFLHIQF